MKKIVFAFIVVNFISYAQVGIGTTTPNGALEINSATNGVLVSNVALTSRIVDTPVVNPNGGALLAGTLVWNTATSGISPNNVIPGFYYWDGTNWIAIAGDGGKYWTATGNSGTTAGTNFIGTTDAADFRIKTGGTDRLNISNTNGQLQSYSVGTAALPTYSFQSNTNTGLFSSSSNNLDFTTAGTARFRIPNANQIQALNLGTAAVPFYSFSGQTTTGIFGVATDVIGFSTAGTERVRIDAIGNVGIGSSPNASAKLEINATNSGLLIPNVALTAKNSVGPITSPATSLLVYNTATAGVSPNNVVPGYYYWNGSAWIAFTGTGGNDWSINGNSGTVSTTNFVGNTDNIALRFRTNNADRFEISSNGFLRSFADGTASLPAYSWNSSQGMGLFRVGADILGLSTATSERMRILADGRVVINSTTPQTSDRFSVYNTTTSDYAINGYSTLTGIGVYGQNTGSGVSVLGINSGTGLGVQGQSATTGVGVYGSNNGAGVGVQGVNTSSGNGVQGSTTSATGAGVFGIANIANGAGVYGTSNGTTSNGVFGISSNASGTGVFGNASSATGSNNGVRGQSASVTGVGLLGSNTNTSGTGLLVAGNNTAQNYFGIGSGAAINGTKIGTLSFGTLAASGNGVIGVGNNLTSSIFVPSNGAGTVGIGNQFGVVGFATSIVNTNGSNPSITNGVNAASGGYFEVLSGTVAQSWSYVGVRDETGINRKIIGNGTVNTIVKDLNGKLVALSSPEAPENLFQDYGKGELINGKAHISIDPIFSKNIAVNSKHPLRVFVQLEGDCQGVYVSNKTQIGFDVTELKNGMSNVSFTYSIVANRADEINQDGTKAKYSEERFPAAPGPIVKTKTESQKQSINVDINTKTEIKTSANEQSVKEVKQVQQMNQ